MQYQVPQFLDIEDKIVGPLTIKQFIFLIIGIGIIMGAFFLLRFVFAFMIAIPVGGLSAAAAFVKIDGMPFPRYVGSLIGFALRPQEYRWTKK